MGFKLLKKPDFLVAKITDTWQHLKALLPIQTLFIFCNMLFLCSRISLHGHKPSSLSQDSAPCS